MGKLADLSVLDDTLIIVTMDHGQNAKGEVYEGGTRVALMARWSVNVIKFNKPVLNPQLDLNRAPVCFVWC